MTINNNNNNKKVDSSSSIYYDDELRHWPALQISDIYEADINHGLDNCKCCTKIIDSYRNSSNTNNNDSSFRYRRRRKRGGYKPTTVQKDKSWLLKVRG